MKFDVCVLGSGFAGSLTGLILARSGMSVAIVDRSSHPRFAIGESSTPAADYLLHQLAAQFQIPELIPLCQFGTWRQSYPQIRCGCKRGFSYVWHGNGSDYQPTPSHDSELLVAASPSRQVADTQWYRPDVDQFFFGLAMKYGVTAFEHFEIEGVQRIAIGQREEWQLNVSSGGDSAILSAEFIIDASGPSSRFFQHFGSIDLTSTLMTKTSAVYTHVEDCGSTEDWLSSQGAITADFPYPIDQAAVHHVFRDGWLWQIGFENNLTSVGFVSDLNRANRNTNLAIDSHIGTGAADRMWQQILNQKPVLRDVMGHPRIAANPGKCLQVDRVQRLRSRASGRTWAALPFTVGFIDPLHSTGIAHSLSGVKRICEALLTSTSTQRDRLLNAYEQGLLGEFRYLDQLISGCYAALADFRLFNCWTMLYFAAATSFERLHRQGDDPSFMLSADETFAKIVRQSRDLLDRIIATRLHGGLDDRSVEHYQKQIGEWIVGYNHVGLFSPKINNMYWHTAAEK